MTGIFRRAIALAVWLECLGLASAGEPVTGAHAKPPRFDAYGDPLPDGAMARLGTIRFRGDAKIVAVSSDGQWIASTSGSNFIHLWEAGTGKRVRSFEAKVWPHDVRALAFSPDSKTLVSGGST